MPAVMDAHIYEIKMVGAIDGQQTINVFYYGGPTAASSLGDLLNGFRDHPMAELEALLSNSWGVTQWELTHVKGGTDFGSFVTADAGSVGGDCLPPFVAWGFTYLRGGTGERNGYKRFAGVAESNQVNGIPGGSAVTNGPALALALNASITDGTTDYNPVIQREQIHGVPQHPPVHYSVSSVKFAGITSQNTRKYGHGR